MQRRALSLTLFTLALVAVLAAASLAAPQRNFTAPLSGDQEAVPVDTNARGVAQFKLDRDGTALSYRLNVANIEGVTMAHIHLGSSAGDVVVWLYPEGPPPQLIPGRSAGTLATGTITAEDLVGPLEGAGLEALLAEILAGEAYVNVHTEAHPGGEIAGRIDRPRGHVNG